MAESQPVSGTGPPEADMTSTSESAPKSATVEEGADVNEKLVTSKGGDENMKESEEKGKKEVDAATKSSRKAASKITPQMIESLIEMNPSLKGELGSGDMDQAREILKKMNISDLMTGMSIDGKNSKDMASYKFWQTQPVPSFDDKDDDPTPDGPIKVIDPAQVSKEPDPLLDGFEWCELDLTNEAEVKEVYELLTFHYVEDANAMFRFDYSKSFLNWALKSPGWLPKWHIGVRATKSRKLVASIFGIPVHLKIREVDFKATEINYLCIHKKLRSKRLAPVLIKEVTRRCYLEGIYQAIYTAGVIIPKPVATCRYFHRPLNWLKLHDVGFSPLPPGSSKARMVSRNQLPAKTSLPGLRPMENRDADAVRDLLQRYQSKFDLSQFFSNEEIEHWLLNRQAEGRSDEDKVVWTFVVEDGQTGKITDVTSFYCLESSVIKNEGKTDGSEKIRAAYLFYYASESAFADKDKVYKARLNKLIEDTLIEAKKANFDVVNALTLQDNPLFLESLRFGAGDGQLHYYLYNYRMRPTSGGLNKNRMPDVDLCGSSGDGGAGGGSSGGVGMVLL